MLILSMHDESIYAERALRAGAQGYIMKQEATEKVLVALRRILSREIYVSERIANRMLQRYIGSPSAGQPVLDRGPDRSGARSLPFDRRGSLDAADRGGASHQREDGGILPGTHQRKALAAQRSRTGAARHSVERRRKKFLTPSSLPSTQFAALELVMSPRHCSRAA